MKPQYNINAELTLTDTAIAIISSQIRDALLAYSNESRSPQHSGDEMDEAIKSALERARALRSIREQYENIACNITWEVKKFASPTRVNERQISNSSNPLYELATAKCSRCGSTSAMQCNGVGCFALEGQDEAVQITRQHKSCNQCSGRGWFYPTETTALAKCKACNGTGDA